MKRRPTRVIALLRKFTKVLFVFVLFAAPVTLAIADAGRHDRPYLGSCDTVIPPPPASFPAIVEIGLSCRVRHLGLTTGTIAQTLNAANVGRLVDEVKQAANGKREALGRLVAQVRDRASRYGAGAAGARQQSAESAQALLATLTQAAEADVVSTLASANLSTSEAAVSRTLGQAQACADALTNGNWQLFDVVRDLRDHRHEAAASIMTRLVEVLTADEHVVPLKSRLAELERDAMQLLAAAAPAPVMPPSPAPGSLGATTTPMPLPPVLPPAPGFNGPELVEEKQALHLTGSAAVAELDDLKARIARDRDLELTLSWRLERKGTKL